MTPQRAPNDATVGGAVSSLERDAGGPPVPLHETALVEAIDKVSSNDLPCPAKFSQFITPLLVFATVATYAPILFNGFVELDDEAAVYGNPLLLHLTGYSFYHFWTTPQLSLYTPLTYTLLGVIAVVARKRGDAGVANAVHFHAWPFHAVSLLLHVLSVVVVYRLLRKVVGRPWPAAAGAMLFALHPVQVESVAWVTEINCLLCGLLSLSALLLFIHGMEVQQKGERRRARSYFILATQVFLGALLAKPLAVVTPLLAVVLMWNFLRSHPQTEGGRMSYFFIGLWVAMAVPISLIARWAQPIPPHWVSVPMWQRPIVAADALAFYLYKLVFPVTLVPDYNRSPDRLLHSAAVYFTWLAPAFVAVVLFWFARRSRWREWITGVAWFVVALAPVLGLVPFAFQHMSTVANRYLYLPMAGVGMCVAWLLSRITGVSPVSLQIKHGRDACDTKPRDRSRAIMVFALAVLALLGVRSSLQTRYWHDTDRLYQHSMEVIGRVPGTMWGEFVTRFDRRNSS